MKEDAQTANRKIQHVKIVLEKDVQAKVIRSSFDDYHFTHYALPEMNYAEINTKTKFLGREFDLPFMVISMTGGHELTKKINEDIALACEEKNIVFAVGSQRAMIENPALTSTFNIRKAAPNVFVAGNIGAYQLKKYTPRQITDAVNSIEANALCIHLNPLQEIVQPEGDSDWSGVLHAIENTIDELDVPVIVKEVGAGINQDIALEVEAAGASAIDVSGTGGTSWAAVEIHRKGAEAGNTFWDFGIPTPIALQEVNKVSKLPLIASGGIRNGLQSAKAIRLGATITGAAQPFLVAQNKNGQKGALEEINKWEKELKIAMFLTRSKNLKQLKEAKLE